MEYMDDLFGQYSSGDPRLVAALAAGEAGVLVSVRRFLRLTPLKTLIRNRNSLVHVLAGVPEMHDRLRATWAREDAVLTAQVFCWVEQSRLATTRSDGRARQVPGWM